MTTGEPTADAVPGAAAPARPWGGWLRRRFEMVIAILLGLASILTAYASFQAALYDGEIDALQTRAGMLSAEAESQYLEGNQQFLRDAQVFDQITQLQLAVDGPDPVAADTARRAMEVLTFQSVSPALAAAMAWSVEQNTADASVYTGPQESKDYLAALFGGYQETKAQAQEAIAQAADMNRRSDQLTLNTVLLAISLFLLGITAVMRQFGMRVVLSSVSVVVMAAAAVSTVVVVAAPAP